MNLIDFINEYRIIPIFRTIDDDLLMSVMLNLTYLDRKDNTAEIQLLINSPGGSVASGLALIDYIQSNITSPITGVITGMAASMAAVLFLSCKKRLMLPRSVMMLHGIQVQNEQIPFAYLKERERYIDYLDSEITKIIMSRSNLTSEEINLIKGTERYITAEEALNRGMCDMIINRSVNEDK